MLMTGVKLTTKAHHKYWSAVELLPHEEMARLQLERLQEQVNYLWDNSKFYRKKWEAAGFSPERLQVLEDIRYIPTLMKEEIRESQKADPPYGMMYVPGKDSITRVALTSGTTGEPVKIPFTQQDYFGVFCEGIVRCLWGAGVRSDDVVHVAFGFTPFVGLAGAYDTCEHFIGTQVVPGGNWNSNMRLQMIKKLGVTVIMGTPTYILHLASLAKENGIDPSSLGVRLVFTTGEAGPMSVPNTAKRIEEAWGCKVYDFAGTQETNYITWMCDEGVPHINDDLVYLEVLDQDSNEPVKPGRPGRLVVTDLVQKTHPVIRFETGDVVSGLRKNQTCKCGRTLSVFKGFRGRVGDIIKVKGVCISVAGIENVIRGIEECSDHYEYEAVDGSNGLDKIVVRIEPKKDIEQHNWDQLKTKVAEALYLSFMINMDIQIVAPGTLRMADLKTQRFRDLRKGVI